MLIKQITPVGRPPWHRYDRRRSYVPPGTLLYGHNGVHIINPCADHRVLGHGGPLAHNKHITNKQKKQNHIPSPNPSSDHMVCIYHHCHHHCHRHCHHHHHPSSPRLSCSGAQTANSSALLCYCCYRAAAQVTITMSSTMLLLPLCCCCCR